MNVPYQSGQHDVILGLKLPPSDTCLDFSIRFCIESG